MCLVLKCRPSAGTQADPNNLQSTAGGAGAPNRAAECAAGLRQRPRGQGQHAGRCPGCRVSQPLPARHRPCRAPYCTAPCTPVRQPQLEVLRNMIFSRRLHRGWDCDWCCLVPQWEPHPEVTAALDAGFYHAFRNVQPTGKRFLLGVDVSGSMDGAMCAAQTCWSYHAGQRPCTAFACLSYL
jgi:hypothetical protein